MYPKSSCTSLFAFLSGGVMVDRVFTSRNVPFKATLYSLSDFPLPTSPFVVPSQEPTKYLNGCQSGGLTSIWAKDGTTRAHSRKMVLIIMRSPLLRPSFVDPDQCVRISAHFGAIPAFQS